MASVNAIQSVGETLRVYLQNSYPQELRDAFSCSFQVVSSGELSRFEDPAESQVALTWFLYRVTVSEHLRGQLQPGRNPVSRPPALPLDLHWMLTVWAGNAMAEHTVFAWALTQLERLQRLDAGMLTPAGGWDDADAIQLVPHELTVEDTMRVWDALGPSYRLSACYVARSVRLDLPDLRPLPVVVTRLGMQLDEPREGGS